MTAGGHSGTPGAVGAAADEGSGTGFEPHRIGARIRELRQDSGVSLTALARQLGVSASAISQIETGVMQPSVSRLVEIMGALNLPSPSFLMSGSRYLFLPPYALPPTEEQLPSVSVARAAQPHSLDLQEGVVYRRLAPRAIPGTEFFESIYPPGAASGPEGEFLAHAGFETGVVTSGRLTFQFGEGEIELAEGDSICFPASKGHRVVNNTDQFAVATWLTVHTGSEVPDDVPVELSRSVGGAILP